MNFVGSWNWNCDGGHLNDFYRRYYPAHITHTHTRNGSRVNKYTTRDEVERRRNYPTSKRHTKLILMITKKWKQQKEGKKSGQQKTNTSWRWRRLCDRDGSSAFQRWRRFFPSSFPRWLGSLVRVPRAIIDICLFIESCASHTVRNGSSIRKKKKQQQRQTKKFQSNKFRNEGEQTCSSMICSSFLFWIYSFFVVFAAVAPLCCDWASESRWNSAPSTV